MNIYALSFLMMIIMVLAEISILKLVKAKTIPWLEIIANLHSGQVVMWLFRTVEIVLFGLLVRHFNFHWVDQWPIALQWLFAFIAWDLCFYWMHRLHHKIPLLWSIHRVHHQGENMNLTLAMRNSWYSSLSNFPFIAVLALLGVPLEIFIVISSIHYSVQFYNHTALVDKSGVLDKVLVTPSNHRVHHGLQDIYSNRNFGGTLLIWDIVFNTYQPERADTKPKYGLSEPMVSYNPLWFNHKWLFDFINKHAMQRKQRRQLKLPAGFIALLGLLLFGLVIFYINEQARFTNLAQWSFFTVLSLASISIGAMSDNKRWGLLLWLALFTLFPIYIVSVVPLYSTMLWIILTMLVLSALAAVLLFFKRSVIAIQSIDSD